MARIYKIDRAKVNFMMHDYQYWPVEADAYYPLMGKYFDEIKYYVCQVYHGDLNDYFITEFKKRYSKMHGDTIKMAVAIWLGETRDPELTMKCYDLLIR